MNGSLLCPLSQPSRRWSGRPIDARALFSGFSSRQKPPCRGPAFPAFLTRIAWIGLSQNRFLRVPCSGGPQPRKTFWIYPRTRRVEVSTTGRGRRLKSGEIPAHGGQFPVRRSKFPARLNKFPVRHELIPCFHFVGNCHATNLFCYVLADNF